MSLEAKIELLTAAVVELTRAMQSRPNPVSAPLDEIKSTKQIKNANVLEEKHELPNEQSQSTTPTSSGSLSESALVSYDDVKQITIAVSKIDKSKAVAGLTRFGAKNAKELKEEQWPEYVAYMTRVAAGEVDPESSHE